MVRVGVRLKEKLFSDKSGVNRNEMEQEQPLEHVCIWPLAIMTLVPWIGSMPGGIITRKDIKYWYEVSSTNIFK